MGLLDKDHKCKYKCNCKLCSLSELRSKALESDDIELVKETLKEFADLWLFASDDANYYQCIFDGSNIEAEEILKRNLKKIEKEKEKKNEKENEEKN